MESARLREERVGVPGELPETPPIERPRSVVEPGVDEASSRADRPGGDPDPPHERPEPPHERPDLGRIVGRLRGPLGAVAVAVTGLFGLALLAALRTAKEIVLPILLAVLLAILLAPVMRLLRRLKIPTLLAAGLLPLSLLAATAYGVYELGQPASRWVERAPELVSRAEWELRGLRQPVEKVQKAAEEVQRLTRMDGESAQEEREVAVRDGSGGSFLSRTREVLVGGGLTFFLLFFLLASGDLFLRKLARVLPRFGHRRKAVVIARRTELEASRYLFTLGMINVGLGLAVALSMVLLGMPNPMLWGVLAGFLNFVPYLGPLVGILITGLVAISTFDALGRALLVPLVYFLLNAIEGNLVTPLVMGRRLTLNPVMIFISVLFWTWLWGIPGALLAVPLLAVGKIVADNISLLAPVGEFLGR